MTDDTNEARIPIVEEQPRVEKRVVETDVVTVRTSVDERTERVTAELLKEEVGIERVPIDREVSDVPEIRWEGEVLVIPVVEEKLVVHKRRVLVEELRIRRERRLETAEIPVTLKATAVSIQRKAPPGGNDDS